MAVTNVFRSMLRMFTTKGDLIAFDGTDNVRVPVGSDDQVLTADSSAAAGVSWQAASGGGGSLGLEKHGVLAPASGLKTNTATTNPEFRVGITADQLVVTDSSGNQELLNNVSLAANLTNSGANGLDTGTEAPSTWYHIWVIYNGTTTASLLSTSSTSPTMPSGYTYKGYVGAVRNDSSSNFRKYVQRGPYVGIGLGNPVANGTATTPTLVDLSDWIPTTARALRFFATVIETGGTTGNRFGQVWSDSAGTLGQMQFGGTFTPGQRKDLPLLAVLYTPQTIYYNIIGDCNIDIYVSQYNY